MMKLRLIATASSSPSIVAAVRRLLSAVLILSVVLLLCVVFYRATSPVQLLPARETRLVNLTATPVTPDHDLFAADDALRPTREARLVNLTATPVTPDHDLFASDDAVGPTREARLVNLTATPAIPDHDLFAADNAENEQVRLERVLKAAAMEDKTVILTVLNAAWASPNSVFDLFMESFRIGNGTRRLLDHLVVVSLDSKAYSRCLSVHNHCFALIIKGADFSGQKNFMSDGYLDMMWRRIDFLRVVLEMGYNFIFTDTDIMWFRDPKLRFYPEGDFQIACDRFDGNATDPSNAPNGGFNYVKSNNRTVEFYKFWLSSRLRHPRGHDQDVLNIIKRDPYIAKIGLTMRFLNTAYFGGLCEPSKDLNEVCTMHANCCIGLKNKVDDLRSMLEDWRTFMSSSPMEKAGGKVQWRAPLNCSLARKIRRIHS